MGAAVEDLRSRCPYFYTVAEFFNKLVTSDDIPGLMSTTFRSRYKVCVVHSALTDCRAGLGALQMLWLLPL